MNEIQVKNITEGTRNLITELIGRSYEVEYLGLEFNDDFIDGVILGEEISTDLARDNIFIYSGYEVMYIEEVNDSIQMKSDLTDEEIKLATQQLDAYLRELSFIRMVNCKIQEVHKLILEGALV